MDFIVCAYGEPGEEKFMPYVENHVAGVELQNYDRKGVQSIQGWEKVMGQHREIISRLKGRLAVHGPFQGIDYTYQDHLLKEAIRKRMDMIYAMVLELKPDTLVLHTGCSDEIVRFSLTDTWLARASEFWREEIIRYAEAGVQVVLENVAEQTPDLMIRLADNVNSKYFGLCMDIGHANLLSTLPPPQWVKKMGSRLKHIHLHDNMGDRDEHLPVGMGNIEFDSFFEALYRYVPDATVSIEVIAEPEEVVENVIYVVEKYGK
jgi:sugar phosphate isomerase/epimerase